MVQICFPFPRLSNQKVAFPLFFAPDPTKPEYDWNRLLKPVKYWGYTLPSPVKYIVLDHSFQTAMNSQSYCDFLLLAQSQAIKILGYVNTGGAFGVVPNTKSVQPDCYPTNMPTEQQVLDDVAAWYNLNPSPQKPFSVDGIFFDVGPCYNPSVYSFKIGTYPQFTFSSFGIMRDFYHSIYSDVKQRNGIVMLNASQDYVPQYDWLINYPSNQFSACDEALLYEGANSNYFNAQQSQVPPWSQNLKSHIELIQTN